MAEIKVTASLAIYASAQFELFVDKAVWEAMTPDDKIAYFKSNMQYVSGLCHQCSDYVDTDMEAATEALDDLSLADLHSSDVDSDGDAIPDGEGMFEDV